MQRYQLEKILKWAYSKLHEGDHSIMDFYEYMKLIDALSAVIEIMPASAPEITIEGQNIPYLKIVGDPEQQDNYSSHKEYWLWRTENKHCKTIGFGCLVSTAKQSGIAGIAKIPD